MQTIAFIILAKCFGLGSLSSESRQKSGLDDSTSSPSSSPEVRHDTIQSVFADQTLAQSRAASAGLLLPFQSDNFPRMDQKISSYDDQNTDCNLDYLLFELQSIPTAAEEISLPRPYDVDFETTNALHIPTSAHSCVVLSRTAKSGVLSGILYQMPTHMKLQQSTQFQELWIVKFERNAGKILLLFRKNES